MNKLISGAIAGTVAVALLSGGAGSFALWNAEAVINAGTIKAGNLTLTADDEAGQWYNVTPGFEQTISRKELATYRIVPGTTLEYKNELAISATGTNLKAIMSADTSAIRDGIGLGISYEVLKVSGDVVIDTTNHTVVVPRPGESKVEVVLTLTYDTNAIDGQNEVVTLDGLKFNLQQVSPVDPTI